MRMPAYFVPFFVRGLKKNCCEKHSDRVLFSHLWHFADDEVLAFSPRTCTVFPKKPFWCLRIVAACRFFQSLCKRGISCKNSHRFFSIDMRFCPNVDHWGSPSVNTKMMCAGGSTQRLCVCAQGSGDPLSQSSYLETTC